MSRKKLTHSEILRKFQFHDTLNPSLWSEETLNVSVRIRLLRSALAFYRFLALEKLKVIDIIVTGSNAGFNYNEKSSDIDLHLVVVLPDDLSREIAENFFKAKKTQWEYEHDLHIGPSPIEMYVGEQSNRLYASGVFSVLRNRWIREPSPEKPTVNDDAVVAKVEHVASLIDDVMADKHVSPQEIKAILGKIKRMRCAGLSTEGEFSVENLSFKALRSLGYIDRLWTLKNKILDDSLSLK